MTEQEILQRMKKQEELVKGSDTIIVNGKERTVNRDEKGRFAPSSYKTSGAYRYRPMVVPYRSYTQANKPKDRNPIL